MTTEIKIIENKISTIVKNALALEINNEFDLGTGVEILSELNRFQDSITLEKERITKPLNEALKVERARWKPLETKSEEGIESIRNKMSVYQTRVMQEQLEKDKQAAQDILDGKIDMDNALATLDGAVETRVDTALGSVTFRETKKFEVMDITMLPTEYLLADETKIREKMKEGVELPGVRYFIEQVPVNRR